MATDYKVRFRSYQTVAELASRVRERLGVAHRFKFNIVKLLRSLIGKEFEGLGLLHLDLFEHDHDPVAYVTFGPLTLHVHREIWEDADIGEPKSRFILAHELGHILMHGHHRQAYSEDEKARLSFPQQEESAEVQANWFAACFLAPDHLVRRYKDETELCLQLDFPPDFASIRFDDVKRNSPKYSGEACLRCGNFTVIRSTGTVRCDTCEFLMQT